MLRLVTASKWTIRLTIIMRNLALLDIFQCTNLSQSRQIIKTKKKSEFLKKKVLKTGLQQIIVMYHPFT